MVVLPVRIASSSQTLSNHVRFIVYVMLWSFLHNVGNTLSTNMNKALKKIYSCSGVTKYIL